METKSETVVKKPVLQFSIPCLEVDAEDKPPIFSYVFYELPYPRQPVDYFICNGWSNGKGKFRQEIRILKPDRSLFISTGEQEFDLKDESIPQLMINQFSNVVFEQFGVYWVQNYLNGELVMEYPLIVREVSQEELNRFMAEKSQEEIGALTVDQQLQRRAKS